MIQADSIGGLPVSIGQSWVERRGVMIDGLGNGKACGPGRLCCKRIELKKSGEPLVFAA
jgi:hypothetical protein